MKRETESEEQSFDATDLEYEANEPERPTGVTDDGWLSIYTMTSGQWYGHTLFQTLTSYGFQLDEQQCMSIRVGDSVIRVMRATQPMTFDIDLLAQQTCNGLVWIIDTETTDALQAIVKLRELTANFAMDMRATIVAKDKQELQQDWFDLVSAYIEARQLETV